MTHEAETPEAVTTQTVVSALKLECRYHGDVIGCLGYSWNWDRFDELEILDIHDEMDIDLRILLRAA